MLLFACQVHGSLKTEEDYVKYLSSAIPGIPQSVLQVLCCCCLRAVRRLGSWPGEPKTGCLGGHRKLCALLLKLGEYCLPLQRAAPQLVECPVSNGGLIVRCSKLYR
jgi:hypothetical protein